MPHYDNNTNIIVLHPCIISVLFASSRRCRPRSHHVLVRDRSVCTDYIMDYGDTFLSLIDSRPTKTDIMIIIIIIM